MYVASDDSIEMFKTRNVKVVLRIFYIWIFNLSDSTNKSSSFTSKLKSKSGTATVQISKQILPIKTQ